MYKVSHVTKEKYFIFPKIFPQLLILLAAVLNNGKGYTKGNL